jgi:hypothetical protein
MATINDALRRAAEDKMFAVELFKNPEKYARTYRLRDDEIKAMKEAISPKAMEALDIDYE